MGVGDWFSTLADNLKISDGGKIGERCRRITRRLNSAFRYTDSETANSFYVGSHGRGTAIDTSDVDLIYELPQSMRGSYQSTLLSNGPSNLLQQVRSSLKESYPDTKIGADGQVVVVSFGDGMTFEVVPAVENQDGSYSYPDANDNGSWRTTNPKPEIQAIRVRNDATNNNLRHLCRMLRAWNLKWNCGQGGLLLDTLAYQFIETWPHRGQSFYHHDYMARDFFAFAASQDENQQWWRAPGSRQQVDGGGFQYRAKRCHNISVDAISSEQNHYDYTARQQWREVFGAFFPL